MGSRKEGESLVRSQPTEPTRCAGSLHEEVVSAESTTMLEHGSCAGNLSKLRVDNEKLVKIKAGEDVQLRKVDADGHDSTQTIA
jgi:hypothetical protein